MGSRTDWKAVEVEPMLLRPEQVAVQLGIGRTGVFALMRSGELRSVKIGGRRRVPRDAVVEYVAGLSA